MMTISVIVSSYNNDRYLALFLDSLERQQRRPDEVIIADDGSAPEVWERVQAIAARSSLNVVAVTQPDEGFRLAAARNTGVRAATGEWLLFFDADMAVGPEVLAEHARAARAGRFLLGNRGNLPEAPTRRWLEQGSLDEDFDALWLAADHRHFYRSYPKYCRHVLARRLGLAARHKPQITGCHFSVGRTDLLAINGFDEQYEGCGAPERCISGTPAPTVPEANGPNWPTGTTFIVAMWRRYARAASSAIRFYGLKKLESNDATGSPLQGADQHL